MTEFLMFIVWIFIVLFLIRVSEGVKSFWDDHISTKPKKDYKYVWGEPMEDAHYNNILDKMQEDNPNLYVPKNWYK
jgi:hypothetical protein